ncbi:GIY-YIG nuclease family protein [Paraglaciecola sp. T6c]|uniref:GIY-YIG nuclease family protein n=1 Tax=Pseudoalteromonas atlantica (strain T6c / ATCC BAA-1087) TaxID=3042615 RepID=UPI001E4F424B|nr:GIY-YIG nuclease family protein [Paraglaciecola sp. T6c]
MKLYRFHIQDVIRNVQPWFLYIIENKYQHYYTGICKDLSKRFAQHNSSGRLCAKALRGKGPLKMIYAVELVDHSDALKMELWVKKLTKAKKVQLVSGKLVSPFTTDAAPLATVDKTEC